MKIALINIPIKAPWLGQDAWITVPPQGYGGVQWVNATLIDGLLELGHELFLLGAPGSISNHSSYTVVHVGEAAQIIEWLQTNDVDIVHDSSDGLLTSHNWNSRACSISTHHLTGRPRNPINTVYLSFAQRKQATATDDAPVVRIPVNPARYVFSEEKGDYLLFLGRISRWKGALEAAAFARAAGLPLVLAGPAWEKDYLAEIITKFRDTVKFVGEVGGNDRLRLLAGARAVLVMSQPLMGPWDDVWSEPGATVVSEAAVSGTPVISTDNGCLAELTPNVGYVMGRHEAVTRRTAKAILDSLPTPAAARDAAIREWGHIGIARQYVELYRDVSEGRTWC